MRLIHWPILNMYITQTILLPIAWLDFNFNSQSKAPRWLGYLSTAAANCRSITVLSATEAPC